LNDFAATWLHAFAELFVVCLASLTFGRCLRLSFGGLSPKDIERGIRTLGGIAAKELNSAAQKAFEPAPALV